MRVPLDEPVAPGGTAEVNVEWTAKVPQPFARTGYVGDYYFIAQWFPKLGVLEDGGLEHASVPLGHRVLRRLRRLQRGHHGAARASWSAPRAAPPTRCQATPACATSAGTDNGDGTTTHRFHAEDVHDFAWTASPDFWSI